MTTLNDLDLQFSATLLAGDVASQDITHETAALQLLAADLFNEADLKGYIKTYAMANDRNQAIHRRKKLKHYDPK